MQFWENINAFFLKYDLNLILYDEVEKFRDWNDDQFTYTYQDRKINSWIDILKDEY